jgi:hypothetical protein
MIEAEHVQYCFAGHTKSGYEAGLKKLNASECEFRVDPIQKINLWELLAEKNQFMGAFGPKLSICAGPLSPQFRMVC